VIHDDKLTGWTFETPSDASGKPQAGGLVLQNVRHQGHNLARDIRVVGVWIEVEKVDASGNVTSTAAPILRTLDAASGFTVSAIKKLEPVPIVNHPNWKEQFEWLKDFDDALNFADYIQDPQGTYSGYGVSATYDAPGLMSQVGYSDCEYAGVSLEQVYLFSRYSDDPPHEPFGFLSGARCHPLVRYEFLKNPAFDPSKPHSRVASIRFDYRLHYYVDSDYQTTNAPQNRSGLRNQAGLFADHDSFGVHVRVTTNSFSSAEKPVVLEATVPALVMGYSDSSGLGLDRLDRLYKVLCWDNIHWWGLRATPDTYISAPGAFHCAHMHWRWGSVLGIFGGEVANYMGGVVDAGPHFTPGTPLVDPFIPLQTIRLAITRNDRRFDPEHTRLADLSDSDWESMFETQNSPSPQSIKGGGDIVLWYSARVHRSFSVVRSGPAGTVFLHGLFFAHDAELKVITAGSTSAEYIGRSEKTILNDKKWFRPAS